MDAAENIDQGAPKSPGMREKFFQAAYVIRETAFGRRYKQGHFDGDIWVSSGTVYDVPEDQRPLWHAGLQTSTSVHAAVLDVLDSDYLPTDLDKLVLEWPGLSKDGRLAYTQSAAKGASGAPRTVTTPGRFITRHWPKLPADYVRDVVARNTAIVEVRHTMGQIVAAVQEGPTSCMQRRGDHESEHPYQVYTPEFGWRIAVRLEGDREIWARALVLMAHRGPYVAGETLDGAQFVRTYKRCPIGGYSNADEALCAWLEQQGAEKLCGWEEDTKLARIRAGGQILAPYIDGHNQRVTDNGDCLLVSGNGEYVCNNTDGTASPEDEEECGHCGSVCDPNDGFHVGRHDDRFVGNCCEEYYVLAHGINGERYYVLAEDLVTVGGEYYHPRYLTDNDIVELDDGEYAHLDDAFNCPVDHCWYLTDDGTRTEDAGVVHDNNAWQCAATALWYSTRVDSVENADGDTCHPDTCDEFVGPLAQTAAAADPYRVFDGAPPTDGWWNVMYAMPTDRGHCANEWSRIENGVFTHRVSSYNLIGTVADWVYGSAAGLQVATLNPAYTLCHRRRHPEWAAEADRIIAAHAAITPVPEDKFAAVRAAHAAGAMIQYRSTARGEWDSVFRNNPVWYDCTEYRVDPAQEYSHPLAPAHVRYRAGAMRIDVWQLSRVREWALDAGSPNSFLASEGYVPTSGRIADMHADHLVGVPALTETTETA